MQFIGCALFLLVCIVKLNEGKPTNLDGLDIGGVIEGGKIFGRGGDGIENSGLVKGSKIFGHGGDGVVNGDDCDTDDGDNRDKKDGKRKREIRGHIGGGKKGTVLFSFI